MTDQAVCLTLVIARSFRAELLDYISEQSDLVSGFTASDAAGHGPNVRLQSAAERVKGHAEELIVQTILDRQNAVQLLARLKSAFTGTRLVYWIMPVTEFGVID